MAEKTGKFFDYYSDAELERLMDYCKLREADKGAEILHEGKEDDAEAYMIIVGEVAIEHESKDGPVIVSKLGSGEVFGEYALFTHQARSATVRATEPTEFLMIDLDKIDELHKVDAELGFKVVKHIAREASRKLSASEFKV